VEVSPDKPVVDPLPVVPGCALLVLLSASELASELASEVELEVELEPPGVSGPVDPGVVEVASAVPLADAC